MHTDYSPTSLHELSRDAQARSKPGSHPVQLNFTRREVKYLLTDAQREALLRATSSYVVPDEHGAATIRSVYYDTPTLLMARRSTEHPTYKEKIRLRCYGTPAPDEPIFVELKKKCRGVVYKRRCLLPEHGAQGLLAGHMAPATQIERELAWTASRYEGLAPRVYLAYDRDAFYCRSDRNLRLTLDRRVRMRWDRLSLSNADETQQILAEGLSILEVKALGALPFWLLEALREGQVQKASWSKYATACRIHLAETDEPLSQP